MSARAWTGFAALSLLWGVPYFFIKVAVDGGMSPAFIAWVRVVLAAAILLALAKRAGVLRSVRGYWPWLAIYALVEITIPFPLIAAGEQHVTSFAGGDPDRRRATVRRAACDSLRPGRALVITYVNPVVAVALGVVILDEHLGTGSVAGLLLIIAGSWLSTDGRLPPRLLTLARSGRRSRPVREY